MLARERSELAPALVLLPDAEVSARMSDKLDAHRFFVEIGIPSPRSWVPDEVAGGRSLPGAREGARRFGSRNIFRAPIADELAFFLSYTGVPSFVQEACLGRGVLDRRLQRHGRSLPERDPAHDALSKGGESIKGASLMDRELIEHGARVAEAVGIKGPANVQCFREPDGSLPITDVNTRFGGGFPVPLAAGGRYPELALALARGERPEPRLGDFREGVVMTRYFSEVCLAPDAEGQLEPILPLS